MYKVTNVSGKDIFSDWSTTLLPDDLLAEWYEFQKSEEYIGRTPEEISANRMALIQNRLQDFVNAKGLGKMEMVRIPTANGVPQTVPRYKHFFPKDSVLLANDRQVEHFRTNERKEIIQKLQPGEIVPKVHYEGFLIIDQVPEDFVLEESQLIPSQIRDLLTGGAAESSKELVYDDMSFADLRNLIANRQLKPAIKNRDGFIQALKEDDIARATRA